MTLLSLPLTLLHKTQLTHPDLTPSISGPWQATAAPASLGRNVTLKQEPFIMHVECRSLPAAERLFRIGTSIQNASYITRLYPSLRPLSLTPCLCAPVSPSSAAFTAGFRESGIGLGKKILVAVRTTANSIEVGLT